MSNKRTIKKAKKVRRIVKKVESVELTQWKKLFQMHGTKTDFEAETGISRRTVTNVLDNKKGEERVLIAIRSYHEKQTA